jgi:MoaA/NifB/PqqE/SkfB family radical SAM enzyme
LRAVLEDTGGIAVRVSVDGLGQLHDRIRGTKGAYDRAMESLEVARDLGVKDVGICATMSRHNAGAIRDVQSTAQKHRVQFTFTVAHSSPVFFGEKRSEEPPAEPALRDMAEIKSRLFASGRPKDWFKGYFVQGMMEMMQGRPRPVRCRAGVDFFYLDPEGGVYPCHLWDRPIGNILEKTYEEMIAEHREVLAETAACRRRCWMTCTVAPEMRRRLPVFAARVGWAKALHHLKAVAKTR